MLGCRHMTSARENATVVVDAPKPTPPTRPSIDQQALTKARQDRMRCAIGELGVDALVLLTPDAVHYATGYRSVGASLYATHRMAAVLTVDDCWLVCPAGDAAAAADSGLPAERIVPFGTFFFESVEGSHFSDNVGRHPHLDAAIQYVVGVVGAGAMYWGVDRLSAHHEFGDRVTLVDATEAVARTRIEKQPAEVEILRYAALLTEAAMASAVAAAGAGITEKELADHIAGVMVAGGGEPRFVVAGTGPRSALSDSFASERIWHPGEILRFDAGCVVDGYWSDLGRTIVLDNPSQVQLARYEAILAGQEAAFEVTKAGATGRSLFESALRSVNDHGLPYRRHHCGHGIGLSIYEEPTVTPAGGAPIPADSTLCIETPYYELGWGGMMVEDTVVVTGSGYQRLNESDRRLWVARP